MMQSGYASGEPQSVSPAPSPTLKAVPVAIYLATGDCDPSATPSPIAPSTQTLNAIAEIVMGGAAWT
jgi:hypothetical protein